MKVSNLTAFVDQENRFAAVFRRNALSLQSAKDRQEIANRLDAALSPENLACDGEIPRAEVARRYRFLSGAAKELLALDSSVKMYEF
jgi:hypothetical protein